jgi:hypothetical protein
MELEESFKRLEAGLGVLMRRAGERDAAFREGFVKGMYLALWLAQGRNPLNPADADLKTRESGRAPKPACGQLDLF